jgi:hypothetical protein
MLEKAYVVALLDGGIHRLQILALVSNKAIAQAPGIAAASIDI